MQFDTPEWIDRITSTNTALLERLERGERVPAGAVLATNEQTAGRGRGARQWFTHPGLDLACSFVIRAPVEPRRLGSLSMAVALGVRDFLVERDVRARTKWPNDVIVVGGDGARAGRKICGILPELPGGVGKADEQAVVVGIGVNVGMTQDEAARIDQPATSLFLETGAVVPARELLPDLLDAVSPRLASWLSGGFGALRDAWNEACAGVGESVTVVDGATRHTGVLAGFGADGQLLLEHDGGRSEHWAGHLLLADRQ